jgi:hypothetical protein
MINLCEYKNICLACQEDTIDVSIKFFVDNIYLTFDSHQFKFQQVRTNMF